MRMFTHSCISPLHFAMLCFTDKGEPQRGKNFGHRGFRNHIEHACSRLSHFSVAPLPFSMIRSLLNAPYCPLQVVSIDNVTNDGSIASTASHQLIIDRFNTSGATQNAQSINFTMYVSDSDAQVWYYNSSGWTEISTEGGTAEYNSSGGAINVVASHTSTFIAATATTDDDSDDGLWGLMALLALPLGICAFFLIKKKRASKAKGSRFVTYAPPYNVVVNDPYMHRFGPPANTPVNVQQPFMYGKMGPYMGPPPPNMPVYARPY